MSNSVLFIIGPTASGKTSLAVKLAKKFSGELVNADSRQVYKNLDIGTAKGKLAINYQLSATSLIIDNNRITCGVYQIEDVPIHLVNIVKPNKVFTLAHYQKLAFKVIEDINKREKLPIVVGGTGLYVDSLIKGYKIPKVKPNKKLRKNLNQLSVDKLQNKLKSLSKKRFQNLNNSDKNNPHRLIRLIEIENATDNIKRKKKAPPKLDVLMLQPDHTRKELYKRIGKRAKKMIGPDLFEEVKFLIEKDYDFSKPALTSLGYDLVKDYLNEDIDKDELTEKFAQSHRNYARRQITWFNRYDGKIHKVKSYKEAKKIVDKWL